MLTDRSPTLRGPTCQGVLGLVFKYTICICDKATKKISAPFHNFLAPKCAVFFQGGSLCEICGQNVRNVGRRAVVM